jgi:serine/threonine-protein kinase RsbW
MRHNEVVRLQIPGETRYIGIARQAVDAIGEQLDLSTDARMAVKIAVGEACNNAVQHTPSGGERDGSLLIACRVEPEALEIDVTNPATASIPTNQRTCPPVRPWPSTAAAWL